jgi:hypothetical protein
VSLESVISRPVGEPAIARCDTNCDRPLNLSDRLRRFGPAWRPSVRGNTTVRLRPSSIERASPDGTGEPLSFSFHRHAAHQSRSRDVGMTKRRRVSPIRDLLISAAWALGSFPSLWSSEAFRPPMNVASQRGRDRSQRRPVHGRRQRIGQQTPRLDVCPDRVGQSHAVAADYLNRFLILQLSDSRLAVRGLVWRSCPGKASYSPWTARLQQITEDSRESARRPQPVTRVFPGHVPSVVT